MKMMMVMMMMMMMMMMIAQIFTAYKVGETPPLFSYL